MAELWFDDATCVNVWPEDSDLQDLDIEGALRIPHGESPLCSPSEQSNSDSFSSLDQSEMEDDPRPNSKTADEHTKASASKKPRSRFNFKKAVCQIERVRATVHASYCETPPCKNCGQATQQAGLRCFQQDDKMSGEFPCYQVSQRTRWFAVWWCENDDCGTVGFVCSICGQEKGRSGRVVAREKGGLLSHEKSSTHIKKATAQSELALQSAAKSNAWLLSPQMEPPSVGHDIHPRRVMDMCGKGLIHELLGDLLGSVAAQGANSPVGRIFKMLCRFKAVLEQRPYVLGQLVQNAPGRLRVEGYEDALELAPPEGKRWLRVTLPDTDDPCTMNVKAFGDEWVLRCAPLAIAGAAAADGRSVAVVAEGGGVRIVNIDTGKLADEALHCCGAAAACVAVMPGPRKLVVSGGDDGSVQLWEVTQPEVGRRELRRVHLLVPLQLVRDSCARPRPMRELPHHRTWVAARSGAVTAVVAQAGLVVAGLQSGQVVAYEVASGREPSLRWMVPHSGEGGQRVVGLLLCWHGRWVLSGADDGSIRCWQSEDGVDAWGRTLWHQSTPVQHRGGAAPTGSWRGGDRLNAIAATDRGDELCGVGDDGRVVRWRLHTAQWLQRDLEHGAPLLCCAYDVKGRSLAAGDCYGSIRVWDRQTRVSRQFQAHSYAVFDIAWLDPGGSELVSVSGAGVVKKWSGLARGGSEGDTAMMEGGTDDAREQGSNCILCIASQGPLLASGRNDGQASVWQLSESEDAEETRVFVAPEAGAVYGCALSSGGDKLAVVCWAGGFASKGVLHILSVRGDDLARAAGSDRPQDALGLAEWYRPAGGLVGVAFAPGDDGLVALAPMMRSEEQPHSGGSIEQAVLLVRWSKGSCVVVARLSGHAKSVRGVCFAPDGSGWLATASEDVRVGIWKVDVPGLQAAAAQDIQVHEPRHMLGGADGHKRWVRHCAWAPGRPFGRSVVASCGGDHVVRLWDAEHGVKLYELSKSHVDIVWGVSFSADGRHLASCSEDGAVVVTDMAAREAADMEVACDPNLVGIRGAAFWGCDKVVAGLPDGTIHVVRLPWIVAP